MWFPLGAAGLLVVLTGWLPADAARDVALTRGAPVLGFLVAITVLAELADRAGVFDAAAGICARAGRGSSRRLFLLIALLGTLTTVGMSLDTTAVLLTPVVLTLTERLGLRPLPFALLVVWLANTASLLLPVSNLTNLLALQRLGLSTPGFAARMVLPELVAVLVTVAYLALLFRRDLRASYQLPARAQPGDRWTFRLCALACLALAPGVLAGAAPWAVAVPCAAVAVAAFAIRSPAELSWRLVPWRLILMTEGLFLVVSALSVHGLSGLIGSLSGRSSLRTVLTAAGASNLINNLPAYLAMERAAPPAAAGGPAGQTHLLAVLLGTDTGPLILVWGSLATLLWLDRCRQRGMRVPARTFAAVGLAGVPLVLFGSWLALLVGAQV